jgi:predicted esterase
MSSSFVPLEPMPEETAAARPEPPGGPLGQACDVELVLPDGYEPNYAYPLVAWLVERLPGREAPQSALFANATLPAIMREVSERNCIGLAIYHDGRDLADRVVGAIGCARKRCTLHTERIHIAGRGHDGACALALGLQYPEWFAGIVALSAPAPDERRLLRNLPALRGKRVLLGVAEDDSPELFSQNRGLRRLLFSAGLDVTALVFDNSGRLPRGFLREIDRFVMQGVARESAVLA